VNVIGGSSSYSSSSSSPSSSSSSSSVSSSVSFGGCDTKAYPVISGSAKVVSVSATGYTLASGQSVIYGSCSTTTACAVGDYVKYNGYLVNGVVNALRIDRVLLSWFISFNFLNSNLLKFFNFYINWIEH